MGTTTVILHDGDRAKKVAGYWTHHADGNLRVWRTETGLDLTYRIADRAVGTTVTLNDAQQRPLPVKYRRISSGSVEVSIVSTSRPAPSAETFDSLNRKRREDQAWQQLGTNIAQSYRPKIW